MNTQTIYKEWLLANERLPEPLPSPWDLLPYGHYPRCPEEPSSQEEVQSSDTTPVAEDTLQGSTETDAEPTTPAISIESCHTRSDIKSDRLRCKGLHEKSIHDGFRNIDVDNKILEVRRLTNGKWGATRAKTGTIEERDGEWSYIGERKRCVFFKDGNYMAAYRVIPYVLV